MNLKKQIQLLKKDRNIVSEIIQEHPPDWNMDAVYQKAYQKYLKEGQDTPANHPEYRECMLVSDVSEKSYLFRRIVTIGSIAAMCAVCVGMYLAFPVRHLPEYQNDTETKYTDDIPDEPERNIPEYSTDFEKEETKPPGTASDAAQLPTSQEIPSVTVPEFVVLPVTTETGSITEMLPTEILPPPVEGMPETEPTEAPSEESETETTENPEPSEEPTTEEATVYKHFEYQMDANVSSSGTVYDGIVYIGADMSAEVHKHAFDVAGFEYIGMYVTSEDVENVTIQYEDLYRITITVFPYEKFKLLFPETNTDSREQGREYYEIDGKAVMREYNLEDTSGNHYSRMLWDDGCHICYVQAPEKIHWMIENIIREQIDY